MWRAEPPQCNRGVSALSRIGLKAEVDKGLHITFHDPQGLYSDLCKLQNRYAFQGTCNFKINCHDKNPKIPTLYIDGKDMGTLNKLKVQDIKKLAEPSPFGRGAKTVYDENVRKASEVKASRINLDMRFPNEIQNLAPTGHQIVPKLYKLAVYEKDGFFAEHSDTLHGDNHIGTLVMCLPVPHRGGAFILSDDGNELRLPFDEMIKGNKIPWVAFYTDVKHKVEVVKSGMRMTLQFDLIAQRTAPEDEDGITKRLTGGREFSDPTKYRFHDFNEEGLVVIKNKIAVMLGQDKKQVKQEKEEEKKEENPKKPDSITMKKRDRPDDDEMIKSKTSKQMKVEELDPEEDEEQGFAKKLRRSAPDGVAILLKRRYGAASLSLDKLKGSDGVLYQALKDDFALEVKGIILEQDTDYEGGYEDEPIEIVALGRVDEIEEGCSSDDEEVGLNPDKKKVPSRPGEWRRKLKVNAYKEEKKDGKEENKVKAKKVFLVSGFSPKSVKNLITEKYIEYLGNEAQSGFYAYMHVALFVYPKVTSA